MTSILTLVPDPLTVLEQQERNRDKSDGDEGQRRAGPANAKVLVHSRCK